MENNIVLNNPDIAAEEDKNLFPSLNISGLFNRPLFKVLFSVLHYTGFAIKVIVLSALSFIYFVIGAAGVIVYMVFFEKLFKTIICTRTNKNQKDPYAYKWKNHHLELNYEA